MNVWNKLMEDTSRCNGTKRERDLYKGRWLVKGKVNIITDALRDAKAEKEDCRHSLG